MKSWFSKLLNIYFMLPVVPEFLIIRQWLRALISACAKDVSSCLFITSFSHLAFITCIFLHSTGPSLKTSRPNRAFLEFRSGTRLRLRCTILSPRHKPPWPGVSPSADNSWRGVFVRVEIQSLRIPQAQTETHLRL